MLVQQQLRHVRTTLLGRTPGWSPPVPPIGPWRPIRLRRADVLAAQRPALRASLDGKAGVVEFRGRVEGLNPAKAVTASLRLRRGAVEYVTALRSETGGFAGTLTINEVDLWWPHTHGEPARYEAILDLRGAQFDGGEHTIACGAVGFRRIELDQRADEFRVVVNGVPVFCRGACWMPLDAVGYAPSPDSYRRALVQVAAAGMNMLRVSGATIYEADEFYELASELGVLVWQDFMFANMDYPEDESFVQAALEEAGAFLDRTASQPCIAVLCGNSEGEQQAAMWGAPRGLWSPRLFHEHLNGLCRARLPDVPYWPSSAHGGAFPHQPSAGTTSYYGVGAYQRPLEDARLSAVRFATECLGFANVPEPHCLAELGGESARVHHPLWKARVPRDLGAGWDFDDVRDHYLKRLYGVEPTALRYAEHGRYMALSRAISCEVMERTFAEWRRVGSRCGGALVWFYRDLWSGAGWGVTAADGTPKAAYYGLRRALAPRAVIISDEGVNGLDVHVLNDRPTELAGRVVLALYSEGRIALRGAQIPVRVAAHGGISVPVASALPEFLDLSYAYRFGPPVANVIVATLHGLDDSIISRSFHLPAGPLLEPTSPGLTAHARSADDGSIELVVTSEQFARTVRVDVPGTIADENYFHLPPGGTQLVRLQRVALAMPTQGSVSALNAPHPVAVTWADGRPPP